MKASKKKELDTCSKVIDVLIGDGYRLVCRNCPDKQKCRDRINGVSSNETEKR